MKMQLWQMAVPEPVVPNVRYIVQAGLQELGVRRLHVLRSLRPEPAAGWDECAILSEVTAEKVGALVAWVKHTYNKELQIVLVREIDWDEWVPWVK